MRQWKNALPSIEFGLQKMSVIAVLLIGTGTIAGVIKDSTLKDYILAMLDHVSMGKDMIAPISGILMSAATASTKAVGFCLFCRYDFSGGRFVDMGCGDG